jgi:RNA recognition motif-containing protein
MNIYVGNMSYDITEDDLRQLFEEHGEVDTVKIIADRDTGRSKGFAFVEMPQSDQANAALESLNGAEVKGRNLKVNEARPREARNRRGGGGGGGGSRGRRW